MSILAQITIALVVGLVVTIPVWRELWRQLSINEPKLPPTPYHDPDAKQAEINRLRAALKQVKPEINHLEACEASADDGFGSRLQHLRQLKNMIATLTANK